VPAAGQEQDVEVPAAALVAVVPGATAAVVERGGAGGAGGGGEAPPHAAAKSAAHAMVAQYRFAFLLSLDMAGSYPRPTEVVKCKKIVNPARTNDYRPAATGLPRRQV
jgi:hypothetical protein